MARKDTSIHLPRMSVTAAMLGNVLGYQTATTETVCGKRRAIKQCAQNVTEAYERFQNETLCRACVNAYQVGVQMGAPALIWPDECRGK